MDVKVFGQKGTEGIKYLGDKPFQWRGEYRLYVWKPNNLAVWVDKRDVACLIKDVGIDNLSGRNLDQYKEKKAERKKKAKEAEVVVEEEQVLNIEPDDKQAEQEAE